MISQRRAESLFSRGDNIRWRVNKPIAAVRPKTKKCIELFGDVLKLLFPDRLWGLGVGGVGSEPHTTSWEL